MAYFVPDLGCSLFSGRQHVKYQGYHFHAENNTCTLAFPNFIIEPKMDPEIMVLIKKATQSTNLAFDETVVELAKEAPTATSLVAKQTYMQPEFTTDQKAKFAKEVTFQLCHEHASLPSRSSPDAIGYGITSIHSMMINPGNIVKIHTGLSCAIPTGMYGRLACHSSLAA